MESSRKTEVGPPLPPGGCPRCGVRLGEPYKYCPNCAYRLRPDLVPPAHIPVGTPPLSQRLVALGGYLLFAAMLLLVVFAGVRLFARPETAPPALPQVIRTRDPGCLALTLDEFVEVPAGTAFWGLYDPGRDMFPPRLEAAAEEKREAELAAGAIAKLGEQAIGEIEEARRKLDEALAGGTPAADAIRPWKEAVARVEGSLGDLHDALSNHASARDAFRAWADAFASVVPHEPIAGMPDAYEVESPFRMAKREVTNDQYFEFLRAWSRKRGRAVPGHLLPAKWKRRTGSRDVRWIYNEREGDFPVVGIPFDAALEFCGWFWEERLRADPDLVVDLPTWKEFVLAARPDLTCNFPWGRTLYEAKREPNLGTSGLWSSVYNRELDFQGEFLDLVGNAAEWVYGWVDPAVAAGLSFEDRWIYRVHEGEPGQPGRSATPFSSEAFRVIPPTESRNDVGFRPVIRRAPHVPSFVAVSPGPVRHQECPKGLLPPERLDIEEPSGDERGERETLDQILEGREPAVSFAAGTEQVTRGFDIAATEVTNRQYLAFLAAISPTSTTDDLRNLLPKGWRHDNLFLRTEREGGPLVARAYDGLYGAWQRLDHSYEPGQENVPVQGITVEQAEAYAAWLSGRLGRRCALPTVAQYLRAGRGDATTDYPWGDDRTDAELAPCYRPEGDPRAFALFPSHARPIVGLGGNVAELVQGEGGHLLLAGGFYDLPARYATLDCFLDASWATVQFVIEPDDFAYDEEFDSGDPLRPRLSAPRTLKYFTGFRVVRLSDPF